MSKHLKIHLKLQNPYNFALYEWVIGATSQSSETILYL